ncbi:TPA: hypothetical protein DD449_00695 [Candidatus Berkelbacteria bacterium]|uniref:Adenylate cyclase n=1 Tax=Berkelbacteria bacterium GW2011_GWE1_39_12 TaxID=1618337 RepID=A0A0G4B5A2_9BACT|nr:MAG: Adenylate cyclase [Berkelbacteria bacterium GW2011_GWE1_39_12]HBO60189.1 hypothetical protein [Candidatus Berkelbacteria bacterium]
MNKKIEVELRGPITKEQFDRLESLFEKDGKFIDHKDRVLICYPDPDTGSFVEECFTDIRVRTTNGTPEMIIKLGKWGGDNENRRELSLMGKPGEFDKMVVMMAALGHKKGVWAVRKGKVFDYKEVEFSLVEVPDHSYYYEAEIMVEEVSKAKAARVKMEKLCKELNLEVFDDDGFYGYINRLNKESNKEFLFEKYSEGFFKKEFGI